MNSDGPFGAPRLQLALDEVHGHDRKDDQSAPIEPMGQHETAGWASVSPDISSRRE